MDNCKLCRKYLYLFLLDAACVFILLFLIFSHKEGPGMFSYADLFMLFGIPAYLFLRAIVSRIVLKSTWWPNLMLLVEIFPGLPLLSGELFHSDWSFMLGSLGVAAIVAAISMVISPLILLIVSQLSTSARTSSVSRRHVFQALRSRVLQP